MQTTLDYRIVGPGMFITATSYGLARYAYGLFIPTFREEFLLTDAQLALIASFSYGSYFLVTLLGIYISSRMDPRKSLIAGGLAASFGMLVMACATDYRLLALGVAVAGVSPGLAYTPISGLISALVSQSRQRTIYAIVNSGTSLGVVLSAPFAILMPNQWRGCWIVFAGFSILSTLWCAKVIPPVPQARSSQTVFGGPVRHLLRPDKVLVLLIATLIGIVTSVYWTFAVDLLASKTSLSLKIGEVEMNSVQVAQLFWAVVGIAGFLGVFAGAVVNRLGCALALSVFQTGVALALVLLPLSDNFALGAVSGFLFGSLFVFVAATLGMWSMEVFSKDASVGFGLVFLALSVGQFFGPLLIALTVEKYGLATMFFAAAGASGLAPVMIFLVHKASWETAELS